MKKSQVLTGVLSAVAIASGVLFSTSPAPACLRSHKESPTFGNSSGSSDGGSGGSLSSFFSKTLPLKSDNASIWMAAGAAGLFGLGALYLTMSGSEKTAAIVGEMHSNNPEASAEELETVVEPVVSEQPEAAV